MKSLGCAPSHMTGVLTKRKSGGKHTYKRKLSEYEDSHLQMKEKGLEENLPSQPPLRTNPADTLIL